MEAPGEWLAGWKPVGRWASGSSLRKATRFVLEPRGPDHPALWVSSHHEHPWFTLAWSHIGKGVGYRAGLVSAFQLMEGKIIGHNPSWVSGACDQTKALEKTHSATRWHPEALPH